MTLTSVEISRLRTQANYQPSSDVAPFWFFIWVCITFGLLWIFAAQAFPKYDSGQGVSLLWVGALIAVGGLIAAIFCYLHYRLLSGRKKAAINELKELNLISDQHRFQPMAEKINMKESILTYVVAMAALGAIVYLVQPLF